MHLVQILLPCADNEGLPFEPELFEGTHHAGGDHAAHRAAFHAQRDTGTVAVRRAAASHRTRLQPPDHLLKIAFGIFTCTPRLGRSTNCVTATLPARLVS